MGGEQWFYSDRGERRGPVDDAMMRQLAQLGAVNGTTLVWRQGMTDWEPAHRHFPDLVPPPPEAGRMASPMAPSLGPSGDYHASVGMGEALRRGFGNYVNFSGRANRGEFWWFVLATVLIAIVLGVVDGLVFGTDLWGNGPLSSVWSLALLIPSLALAVRRLHDIDRSGWWVLIALVPVVGGIILLVWYCTRGTSGPNRFG